MAGVTALPQTGSGQLFWGNNARYVPSSTGAIPSTNTATTFQIVLADLALTSGQSATGSSEFQIFDAKSLTIALKNNGTGQTITSATLTTNDTLADGTTISITYPFNLPSGGLASGSSTTQYVPVNSGQFRYWTLTVTFAAAPTTGSVDCLTTVQGPGSGSTALSGSLAPVPGPVILTVFNNIVIPAGGQTSLYSVSNTDSNGNRKWSKMYVNVTPGGNVNFALWWPTSTGGSQGTTIVNISAITSPLVEGPYDVSELPYIAVQLYNNSSTNATTGSSLLLALGA